MIGGKVATPSLRFFLPLRARVYFNDMEKKKSDKSPGQEYIKYTGLGFEILAYILLFVGMGYGLDKWLDTKPWFTLFLSLFGCGAAMYQIVKKLGNIK